MSYNQQRVFGRNLRYYRILQGLTQEQFGDIVDVDPHRVSDYECGRTLPRPGRVALFAKVLGIAPGMLFISKKN